MKTGPIIFNTEMVNALLDGRKTVTRRPPKKEVTYSEHGGFCCDGYIFGLGFSPDSTMNNFVKSKHALCQVGDLLYVRETFRLFNHSDECGCSDHCFCPPSGTPLYFATHNDGESKWKPSIHMPRKFSRLTLKVTDVRIERLHDITEDQAKNEGCFISNVDEFHKPASPSYIRSFKFLWDSIYKNWLDNPYIWVIEFDVINQNIDDYIKSLPSK
ncbi:hypothetical protein ERJ77_01795 [Vibrio anguillarum]|uniref:RNA binding protein n=1 Tax=Vibrio anguillarum TaxID=55601 RepID=A0AAW4B6L2_VIBAN|nr:hypothetical protein [Vibrio anguillarum]